MNIGFAIEVDDNFSLKQAKEFAEKITEFAEKLKEEMAIADSDVRFLVRNDDKTYEQKKIQIFNT